jgi:ABC-2 type transport system ATP-binding protein
MTPSPAIETRHLCKTFGAKTAVSDLTLTVEPGEVFGFLGPNGAGKTTSVKMLLGLINRQRLPVRCSAGEPSAASAFAGALPFHDC